MNGLMKSGMMTTLKERTKRLVELNKQADCWGPTGKWRTNNASVAYRQFIASSQQNGTDIAKALIEAMDAIQDYCQEADHGVAQGELRSAPSYNKFVAILEQWERDNDFDWSEGLSDEED